MGRVLGGTHAATGHSHSLIKTTGFAKLILEITGRARAAPQVLIKPAIPRNRTRSPRCEIEPTARQVRFARRIMVYAQLTLRFGELIQHL